MPQQPLFSMPKGLSCGDHHLFLEKVARFRESGATRLHIVLDFDRTLTVSRPGAQEDVTTWHIVGSHLSQNGRLRYQELFEKYRILELEGRLTERDAVDWWSASFQLYVDERININQVDADFLARASMRPGTAALFALCQERKIPSVIMSAGIRDVIKIWARKYGINPSLVVSTALRLAGDGTILGWDERTLIHVLNKHEAGHEDLTAIRAARSNVIVVGDGMADADMAAGDANVLRVRVFDPRPDEVADISAVRQKTFARFDVLLESGTFDPLFKVLEFVTTP